MWQPPVPLRFLPGGAHQFAGGTCRPLKSSAFHGARSSNHSVEFVPGDSGHQPRDDGPRTGQCSENYGEDHPRFIKAKSRTALGPKNIRDPAECVASVRNEAYMTGPKIMENGSSQSSPGFTAADPAINKRSHVMTPTTPT